jgi:hypothetical protein
MCDVCVCVCVVVVVGVVVVGRGGEGRHSLSNNLDGCAEVASLAVHLDPLLQELDKVTA